MNLLPIETAMDAAKDVISSLILDELTDEDSTASLPYGISSAEEMAETIVRVDTETSYIFGRLIGRIENAWGHPAGLKWEMINVLDVEEMDSTWKMNK